MTSTSAADATARRRIRRAGPALLAVVFWLTVWQAAAMAVGRDFLLATPGRVLARLGELVVTADFWQTVGTTLMRIALGFAAAVVVGAATAAAAARFRLVAVLVSPLVSTIRSVPVVSFIILVLLWADARSLATITSFLMVLPIMHASILEGIRARDRRLLEAVAVFDVPALRRIRAVDVPAVLPFFAAACRIGMGLAWKSGVAAELIGVSEGSIGERLYQAKIFLESADLFAWTVVIVVLSMACEALALRVVRLAQGRLGGGVV